jgi:hydrogenase nickel incorporation protein HypA/HybF
LIVGLALDLVQAPDAMIFVREQSEFEALVLRLGPVVTYRVDANVRGDSTLCGEEAPLHELGITQSIVDQVAQAAGDTHVSSIRLEIGKLSGVSVDSIRFCFELVASGTVLEGADLRIDMPAGRAVCASCGSEFILEDVILLCPCGSADVKIIDGNQMLIKSVEVV